MKTLWITTFNKKLYNLSGRQMLESFLKTQTGDMFIGWECEPGAHFQAEYDYEYKDRLEWFNITRQAQTWDKKNEDIIPIELGGKCTTDLDKEILPKYGSKFNSRASQFFRKVLTIENALAETYSNKSPPTDHYLYDYYIFVDCDCLFKKTVPAALLNSLAEYDLVYHLGKWRRNFGTGCESGILSFKPGSIIIQNWISAYFPGGNFRSYERWDDGYVLRKKIEEHEQFKIGNQQNFPQDHILDLVKHLEQPAQDIVGNGPFKNYISHMKGKHQKEFGPICISPKK